MSAFHDRAQQRVALISGRACGTASSTNDQSWSATCRHLVQVSQYSTISRFPVDWRSLR
jgi:hypothetical protein